MPKNLKVMILIFRSDLEYNKQLSLFKTLRSPFVSPLLDSWVDRDASFIVVERGSYTVDHYFAEVRGNIDYDT